MASRCQSKHASILLFLVVTSGIEPLFNPHGQGLQQEKEKPNTLLYTIYSLMKSSHRFAAFLLPCFKNLRASRMAGRSSLSKTNCPRLGE
jgi:hypothetical protein